MKFRINVPTGNKHISCYNFDFLRTLLPSFIFKSFNTRRVLGLAILSCFSALEDTQFVNNTANILKILLKLVSCHICHLRQSY